MKVGDLVMLSSKNLRTLHLSKKLNHKMQGPLEIEKVVSLNVVILKLPRRWRLNNIFHVSGWNHIVFRARQAVLHLTLRGLGMRLMRSMLMSRKANGRLMRLWEVPMIRTAT